MEDRSRKNMSTVQALEADKSQELWNPAVSPVGNEVGMMRSSMSEFANALSEQLASSSVLKCCCKLL